MPTTQPPAAEDGFPLVMLWSLSGLTLPIFEMGTLRGPSQAGWDALMRCCELSDHPVPQANGGGSPSVSLALAASAFWPPWTPLYRSPHREQSNKRYSVKRPPCARGAQGDSPPPSSESLRA